MKRQAGWVTGGALAALGAFVCVISIGHEDRHLPHPAVLRSDVGTLGVLGPVTDSDVHIQVHLPPEFSEADGSSSVVTLAAPAEVPRASPPLDTVEQGSRIGRELRM
jgi:hypothetical protein